MHNIVPMSRQLLELRTSQQLTLTPALQQSLRILQLSTLDLESEVSRALAENPLLESQGQDSERDEKVSADAAGQVPMNYDAMATPVANVDSHDAGADAKASTNSDAEFDSTTLSADFKSSRDSRDDDQDVRPESAVQSSLRDYLLDQLKTTRFSVRDAALVEILIEELDDDGLLASPLEEIVTWMDPALGLTIDDFAVAVNLLHSFDPPGIGARDLSECLDLQLQYADLSQYPEAGDRNILALAREICRIGLPILATGNMGKLRDMLGCDVSQLKLAHGLILKLNPRPASNWTRPAAEFAVPDVIVRKVDADWRVFLNDAVMPKLRVNEMYAKALGTARSGANADLHGKLQEARWLIRNVAQRFDTIRRVAEVIVHYQQDFFLQGWQAIRPLTLKDVAGELGMHESTISRATTQKFILTPFGTVELKRFFSTGLASSGGGEATSATAIQTRIKALIDAEDRHKPLSDSQLVSLLEKDGISVARRTVAKYREVLRIPTAPLRKSQAQAN